MRVPDLVRYPRLAPSVTTHRVANLIDLPKRERGASASLPGVDTGGEFTASGSRVLRLIRADRASYDVLRVERALHRLMQFDGSHAVLSPTRLKPRRNPSFSWSAATSKRIVKPPGLLIGVALGLEGAA
jgi:hypothetical protein